MVSHWRWSKGFDSAGCPRLGSIWLLFLHWSLSGPRNPSGQIGNVLVPVRLTQVVPRTAVVTGYSTEETVSYVERVFHRANTAWSPPEQGPRNKPVRASLPCSPTLLSKPPTSFAEDSCSSESTGCWRPVQPARMVVDSSPTNSNEKVLWPHRSLWLFRFSVFRFSLWIWFDYCWSIQ